jgi:hypothetical protein
MTPQQEESVSISHARMRSAETHQLEPNNLYVGRSELLMQKLKPDSIALSFWSPLTL